MLREESPTSNILNVEGLVHLNSSIIFFKIILISINRHQFYGKVVKINQKSQSCCALDSYTHCTCQTTVESVQCLFVCL